MDEPIRIVVVDDHPLFRDGVVHTLRRTAGFEVVGEGQSATDALRLTQELLPDIVLLDLTMPGGGLNAARGIAECCPVTRIVVLTVSENQDDLLAAMKAGARAYILKGVAAGELISIVRSVNAGEVYVPPSLAAGVLVEMTRTPRTNALHELTEREKQILELLAAGASNREVGLKLHLAEKTVKHYVTNILQKLQVRSRLQAALLAQKAGLGEGR